MATHLQSLADAPGTLREYETIYICKPDTGNDKVADVNGRVREIIESRGGKVLQVDNWGKRRLAYEVKKQLKGIYLYWQYLGSPDIVAEFERNMRMLDPVIRYMTVKVDTDVVPDNRASEIDEESYEKAAQTAADEEELMMRRSDYGEGEGEGEGEKAEGEGEKAEGEGEGEKAAATAEGAESAEASGSEETASEAPEAAEKPAETSDEEE